MTQINAYKKFPLCGAEMEIVLYDVNQFVSESYFFEIQQEAKRLEKIFTFFDNASELSILNQEGSLFTSQEQQLADQQTQLEEKRKQELLRTYDKVHY